jgi:hypothetical protein
MNITDISSQGSLDDNNLNEFADKSRIKRVYSHHGAGGTWRERDEYLPGSIAGHGMSAPILRVKTRP